MYLLSWLPEIPRLASK